jgi:hypothetical protein
VLLLKHPTDGVDAGQIAGDRVVGAPVAEEEPADMLVGIHFQHPGDRAIGHHFDQLAQRKYVE